MAQMAQMPTGEMVAGERVPLAVTMDFSQLPDWQQEEAFIVVHLRNGEDGKALAVMKIEDDGKTAVLLPAAEAKDFAVKLFRDATD